MISHDELKRQLDYNFETGIFTWKVTNSNIAKSGSICNCLNVQGYIQIRINKKLYLGHRLAWFYVYGKWPTIIDHINGNRNDNKISNLREVTHSQNLCNSKLRKDNTTGAKGVYWIKNRNHYRIQIFIDGKSKYIGTTKDYELAELISIEARNKYHGEFARSC